MITLNFTDIWNGSLITEERELKVRDYCWASELYKPMVDRYLAMKATAPTNPPNTRSMRKFYAGNVWEFIAGVVLKQLGIVHEQQEVVWTEDCSLRVKGKLDFLIGGVPDFDKARDSVNSLPFPPAMMARFLSVIDRFEQTVGSAEIKMMVYEIKSCAHYLLDLLNDGGFVIGHRLQNYHYCRGLGMDEGHVCYISKDDALVFEDIIKLPNNELKQRYEDDLTLLKGHLDADDQPEPAPLMIFEHGKFNKNFGIEYSSYLTHIYGFERPDLYAESVKGKVTQWNNVLKRLRDNAAGKTTPTGKEIKITPQNLDIIGDMSKDGYDAYELAKLK